MNTCPATIRRANKHGVVVPSRCGGWLAFVGITTHRTFGWRRWSQCTSPYCGLFVAANEFGDIGIIQRTEPDRRAFRSTGLSNFEEAA